MKTHSNGCKPRIAITLSGWNTSPSIQSLIAIAPTIVFKSSSGESTCSELDYEIPDTLSPSVAVCIQLLVEVEARCDERSCQNRNQKMPSALQPYWRMGSQSTSSRLTSRNCGYCDEDWARFVLAPKLRR